MSAKFFEQPILNSPYGYPSRHWRLENGVPTDYVEEERRFAPPHRTANVGGDDGAERRTPTAAYAGSWIPAYAGMTVRMAQGIQPARKRRDWAQRAQSPLIPRDHVIPA